MEVNYDHLDKLLKIRSDEPQLYLSYAALLHQVGKEITNLKFHVGVLVDHGLFEYQPSGQYSEYVMITALGRSVVRNGGFKKFKEEQDLAIEKQNRKEKLELYHLEQSVKINKYQFWIMMIGAVGGSISFFIIIYQFLFGQSGFFNN